MLSIKDPQTGQEKYSYIIDYFIINIASVFFNTFANGVFSSFVIELLDFINYMFQYIDDSNESAQLDSDSAANKWKPLLQWTAVQWSIVYLIILLP